MCFRPVPISHCFNTQPPEGGWMREITGKRFNGKFQHTAARRRLASIFVLCIFAYMFQHTAARRRLETLLFGVLTLVCFNTQPPEGGWDKPGIFLPTDIVSTHSRPKAAGTESPSFRQTIKVSTHSRPKAAGFIFS